jgi:hypothetical protein
MGSYSICRNPNCRFVLDRRVNGKPLNALRLILKKCPACSGEWSSLCPFCGKDVAVELSDGHLQMQCCGRGLHERVLLAS